VQRNTRLAASAPVLERPTYAARHLVALLLLLYACAVDEAKAPAVTDTSVDTSDTSVERWRGRGSGHPAVDYFGTADGVWDTKHMNDPGINPQDGTVDATGANPGCVTPEGLYDLHGNLHEWGFRRRSGV